MRTKNTQLLEWLKTASDEVVERTGTTRGYLKQIAYGNKQASASVASSDKIPASPITSPGPMRPASNVWPSLTNITEPPPDSTRNRWGLTSPVARGASRAR